MSELIPVLLAAAGGGAALLAAVELWRAAPAVARPAAETVEAIARAGAEGRSPSHAERVWAGWLAGLLAGLLALLLAGPGPLAVVALAGPWLAGRLFRWRADSYRRSLGGTVPEIASALADSLAGGSTIRVALIESAPGLPGAAAVEMRRVRADLELGSTLRAALGRAARRAASPEFDQLVAAILSQEQSGGDLAELLRRHARAAEGRRRGREAARVATAQARLTGWIVVALPAAALLLVELLAPGFSSRILADPVAAMVLALALLLQFAGFALIRRLGRPEQ